MKLNVPLIRQKKNSVDCGIASLSMILKYYHINKSIAELKKEIKVYKHTGSYAPQLGRYLLDNGFRVEIVTMSPFLFTRRFRNKSQKYLLKHLEKLRQHNKEPKLKRSLRFFIEFIRKGGKVIVKIPTIEDIREEILNKKPLGAIITSRFLLARVPSFNFHFNVITGIDGKYIYVNDPLWDYRGGKHRYEINDFMYALYASAYGDSDNASLMKIKPPRNILEKFSSSIFSGA